MKKPNPLLAAMQAKEPQLEPAREGVPKGPVQRVPAIAPVKGRAGQKHLGAYFDKGDPILERVAILRTRLDMNNSELIEYALNELWARHEAERAFGD